MPMKVNDLFLNINSEQHQEMLAYYRDVIGLPPNPNMGEFALAAGATTIGFDSHSEVSGKAKDPARMLVNLFVDDIDSEQTRLEGAGVKFFRTRGVEFWGGVISSFHDPDGNIVQIIQYRPELATEGTQ